VSFLVDQDDLVALTIVGSVATVIETAARLCSDLYTWCGRHLPPE